jgi:hypothetical protein
MKVETKDAYGALFDTEDLKIGPSPKPQQATEHRTAAMRVGKFGLIRLWWIVRPSEPRDGTDLELPLPFATSVVLGRNGRPVESPHRSRALSTPASRRLDTGTVLRHLGSMTSDNCPRNPRLISVIRFEFTTKWRWTRIKPLSRSSL